MLSICTLQKLNGTCDARSEWTNGRVSLSAAFGEFSVDNTLLIYNDSMNLNLTFKDLCHFMNVSLLAVFFFFIFSLNHWPWEEISVTAFAKRPEKKKHFYLCFSYTFNVKVSVNNILFQVFGRCWSAFLYVDNIRQNHHVGNVDTTVLFFAKWLYVLSDS